jgi:hypothetical protein
MLQRSEGAAIQQVGLNILKRFFHFAFGEKRALQTVVTVAYKFLPSCTLFIR